MRTSAFAVIALVFAAVAIACAAKEAGSSPAEPSSAMAGEIANKSAPPAKASFGADVMPIFKASCARCHGNAGGLSLESYDALMAGANGEKMVVPGKPDESALVKFVDGSASPRMPIGADPLPKAQIDAIRAWIAAGAKND